MMKTKESFYVNKNCAESVNKTNSSFTSKTSTEEANLRNNTTPPGGSEDKLVNKGKAPGSNLYNLSMNDVHLIVEKKVNKCLEPFVEKITCLLKDYEILLNEKAVIEEKHAQLENDVSNNINTTNLIEQLKNEISILKTELNNKNKIIKIISQGHNNRDSPKKAKTFESNDARVKDTPQHFPSVNNSNKKVTILGDSNIKQIKANKLRKNLSGKEKVFVKSCPGATVSQMHQYVKPSI